MKPTLNREQEAIVFEAWRKFSDWCREHDPDGELGTLEAVDAYSGWCAEQETAFTDDFGEKS